MDLSKRPMNAVVLINVNDNAKLTMLSGYYYSNSLSSDVYVALIELSGVNKENQAILNIEGTKADNCTENIENYHTGLCIYNNSKSATVKNNASSYNGVINIYGGSLVSNNYAYMTDAPGGKMNIYGGYFNGKNDSIYTSANTSNTVVNVCGGEFDSPIDIYSDAKNSFIYYRNDIGWKGGNTPIIGGNYKNNAILKSNLVCD